MRILIVEDEKKIVSLLQKGLELEGYTIDISMNGVDAIEKVNNVNYDCMLLDIMIPSPNGLQICHKLREQNKLLPILLLTAKDTIQDKIDGFSAGADDYVIKPFSINEVTARIRALLRRGDHSLSASYILEDLSLDPIKRIVRRKNKVLYLTSKEYSLLEFFFRHTNSIVSKEQILSEVWDNSYEGVSNIVETYIRYLRKKLHISPTSKELIHTLQGRGYSFHE